MRCSRAAAFMRSRGTVQVLAAKSISLHRAPITSPTLPDADDRHVLAAAIHGGATIIVTMNLRDFPAAMLATHGMTALHPDTFTGRILENEPDEVIAALR
jgi:hypothetical protein